MTLKETKQLSVFWLAIMCVSFLAIAFAGPLSCRQQPPDPQKTPSFSAAAKQKMDQVVEKTMQQYGIPGVIVGVWVPSRGAWVKTKGKSNITTGKVIEPDERVRVASITKTFIATVVLQLAEENKLSLDDKLEKYAPNIPRANEITIRQLCNMTSGIYSIGEDEKFNNILASQPLGKWTPPELVNIALSHDPYFAPGQGWHYSDTNYILLGIIIQKVTGNRVEEEVQRRIIGPLGLKNTTFPEGPDMTGKYARGYMMKDGNQELVDITRTDPSGPWAAGAIVSNLDDLKVWVKALADGQLLNATSQKEQLKWIDVPSLAKLDGKYGLGILSISGFVGHNGTILGYNSAMYHLTSQDATIIVLINKFPCEPNSESIADKIFLDIARIIFPHEVRSRPK